MGVIIERRKTSLRPLLVVLFLALTGCRALPSPPVETARQPPPTPAPPPSTTPTTLAPETTTTTTQLPSTSTTTTLAPLEGLELVEVAHGLNQPTAITGRKGDELLYVAERTGSIRPFDPGGTVGDPIIDLSDEVTANGIEQGLLGIAFHPEDEKRLFAYYVDGNGSRTLSEFDLEGDRRVLFSHPQPPDSVDIRHYGGHLLFGPDGNLFVSLGDGADARGQGQNRDTVFGTLLRLDVDDGDPYAIPAGNPFPEGGAPEVWAYGMRNPWRFAIDSEERLIYVADVGQETWEEINVLSLDQPGANLGWPAMEGTECFLQSDCRPDDFAMPIHTYSHDDGCSITGGVVYRGEAIPELSGHYFYSDWCGGWVRSLRYEDGTAREHTEWSNLDPGQVNAFGTDAAGEILITSHDGTVWKIVPSR